MLWIKPYVCMLWKGYIKQFKDMKCSNIMRYFLKPFCTYPNGAIFSAAYQSGGEQCTLSWRSTLFTWALSRGLCNSSTVPLQLSKAHRQLSVKLSGASVPISKYTRSFSECLLTQTWARTTHARSQDRLVLSSRQQKLAQFLSLPSLLSHLNTNPTNHLRAQWYFKGRSNNPVGFLTLHTLRQPLLRQLPLRSHQPLTPCPFKATAYIPTLLFLHSSNPSF